MLQHAPVALITEKLRGQTLDDDLKVSVPREGALHIEGKNVWLWESKDQPPDREKPATTAAPPSSIHGSHPPHGSTASSSNPHRLPKTLQNRTVCDTGPGTMLAPPKKKHCRSLSVPADNVQPTGAVTMSTSPHVEGARVWRPIPVAGLTCSGGGQQHSNRTVSGFASLHHSGRTCSGFAPVACGSRLSKDFRSGVGHVPCVSTGGSACKMGGTCSMGFPGAPSPQSVDSGRDTTSDLQTPPASPVPRPSSAASLCSRVSCNCSAPWLDSSPGRLRHEVLQSRSLSCEEQGSVGLASGSAPNAIGTSSAPLSPCRSKIPRCHSQPCVLHDRRCGKKRRRDAERPMLDFHKMTETAYTGKETSSGTPAQDIHKGRWRSDLDYMCVSRLMPIASSPRDTDLPNTPLASEHAAFSLAGDVDAPYVGAISCTRLSTTPPTSDISSGIDIQEPVKLIGEEEEEEDLEEELSNCNCYRNVHRDDNPEFFPLTDLDLEQIENH